jgi:lipoate-protein ligase A
MTRDSTIPFRVIDSGVREGRLQIAFDRALIDLHSRGAVPDTVRFLRFPPTALIGRHQALAHELKLNFCAANDIGIVRRITGGGAIYLDEGQLGWELVFSRRNLPLGGLAKYTQAICSAVAAGLSKAFGIDAQFRPRNDIEVDGRKLCGTGGFFDGDTLIYQGTVLVDVDPERLVACLNVPEAKLKKRNLDSAAERIVTLKDLLGGEAPDVAAVEQAVVLGLSAELGIEPREGTITAEEDALAQQYFNQEIGTDAFVHAIDDPLRTPDGAPVLTAAHTCPGGTVSTFARLEGAGAARRIREVLFTGDFFVTPPRTIFDLEAALRGVTLDKVAAGIEQFFAAADVDLLTIGPGDFATVLAAALATDMQQ